MVSSSPWPFLMSISVMFSILLLVNGLSFLEGFIDGVNFNFVNYAACESPIYNDMNTLNNEQIKSNTNLDSLNNTEEKLNKDDKMYGCLFMIGLYALILLLSMEESDFL